MKKYHENVINFSINFLCFYTWDFKAEYNNKHSTVHSNINKLIIYILQILILKKIISIICFTFNIRPMHNAYIREYKDFIISAMETNFPETTTFENYRI